ncbi:6-phosphogluconolactonase [bacterium]|nr:6-phosphogluconolactonase [bacterium]
MKTSPIIHGQIRVSRSQESFPSQAAERIKSELLACLKVKTNPSIALSGGVTPKEIYARLSELFLPDKQSFSAFRWFQTDERNVPPDHKDSNQKMIRETLFQKAALSDDFFFPVPVFLKNPSIIVQEYENTIRANLSRSVDGKTPEFDLVLLGIGEDGHVASLFPEIDLESQEQKQRVFNHFWVDSLKAIRYSLTFPVLIAAKKVAVFATGSRKSKILEKTLLLDENVPANKLCRTRCVEWWLDPLAAELFRENLLSL